MNIRGLMSRLNTIEKTLPHAAVYLWNPTEAEVYAAIRNKAEALRIPENRIAVHTYRWNEKNAL